MQIFEDPAMCKNLPQRSMGKKIILVAKNKPGATRTTNLSMVGWLVVLEERMGSVYREIESLCISESPSQQHGRKQLVSRAPCEKVLNKGMLEMSLSNQGDDTSVRRDLDEEPQ